MTESQSQEPPSTRATGFWIAGALLLTVVLWGLAVVLPVWATRSDQTGDWTDVSGAIPALIGFLGLLVYCPAWFANLLLVPLCIMLIKRRNSTVLSLIAFAVAATAYAFPAIYGDNDRAVVMGRLVGFYLWLGSFVTIAIAHLLLTGATQPRWKSARAVMIALMILAIVGLEWIYRIDVSPLERALKSRFDPTALTAALARNPPQAEKDAALWWAVRQDYSGGQRALSNRVTLLIEAGANPNQPEKSGQKGTTLLMQALQHHGSDALVELLVRAGADVNARDWRGKTVLDIAHEYRSSPECERILVKAGARPGGQPNP